MDIVRFPPCTGSYNNACMIFVGKLHYKFQRQKSLINVLIFFLACACCIDTGTGPACPAMAGPF